MFRKGKGEPPRFADLPPQVRLQFEKLRSSIVLASKSKPTKSLLFTSYNHGEGTSTVAAHFAESLSQDKKHKVLMVDANTRRPALHEIVGNVGPNNNLTFSDLFSQQIEKWVFPKASSDMSLYLLASGDMKYHPSQSFDHVHFEKFVKTATKVFDFVIFDSSPIGKYFDSIVLASHVDGVILVIQAEETPCHELRRAKQMLQEANITIVGVVLNRRRYHIPGFIFESFLR